MTTSDKLDQLLPALIAAQAGFRPAAKGAENPHFRSRYADLGDVWEACAASLAANGLAVTYPIDLTPEGLNLSVVLWHSSGQWMSSTIPITGDLRRPQEVGSCITYYRRYLLAALLAIPTVDDDGEAASAPGRKPEQRRQERPQQPARRDERPSNGHDASEPVLQRRVDLKTYLANRIDQAWKLWKTEMTVAGIDEARKRHPDFQMPNIHAVVNHFVTHAIETGAIRTEDIAKNGKPDMRDATKAKAALAALFERTPKRFRERVEEYFAQCEQVLRVKLGMNDAVDADVPWGREPGEDG